MLLADGLGKKDTNWFYLPTAIIPTTKRSSNNMHDKDATMVNNHASFKAY